MVVGIYGYAPEFHLIMIFVLKWLKFENVEFPEFTLTIYFQKMLTFQKSIEIITFEPKILVQNAIFVLLYFNHCIFIFGQNMSSCINQGQDRSLDMNHS